MTTKTYDGIAYRQATDPGSPWIVSFVAPAEEILEWAGIPRRSSDAEMMGFQRTWDDKRVEKAKRFFEVPLNQSPTAIVVGVHPQPNGNASRPKLTFTSGAEGDTIRHCKLSVPSPAEMDDEAIVSTIRTQIKHRLARSPGIDESAEDPVPEDVAVDPENDDDVVVPSAHQIELGRSLLMKLDARLDDPTWRAANRDALRDLAKPATVIDGQHRLKGAERCERGVPFAVCALFDCEWAEQVFQFTVVNYTQEGIEDQFITNNAALSLTQKELGDLQDRLVQAGVNVVEYELMKVVHFHDESPFKDLVNLTEKKDRSKIGYKTMVRLAQGWFDAHHQVFRQILPNLYPDIPKKRDHKLRVERWKNQDWGLFFLDFWKTVHDAYRDKASDVPGHFLWEVGHSNLMVAIVLFELQSAFFDHVNGQDEEFFQARSAEPEAVRRELRDKLQRRAKKFVEWFPPEFFGTTWASKSLSIGPGRKALQDCFTKLITSKGNYGYGKSGLVTGQTAG
ncbi:MAG TPA: hypothetical protein VMT03_26285 [Polyangia bacterium]|nr:hypothetical protein [Polyangia bacterium]